MMSYDLTWVTREYGVIYGLLSLAGLGVIGGILGYLLSKKCHEWAIPLNERRILQQRDPWHRGQEWTYESLGIWTFLVFSFYLDSVWFFAQGANMFNLNDAEVVVSCGLAIVILNAWSSSFLVEARTGCWGSGKNFAISDGVSKFWWTFWMGTVYGFFYVCNNIGIYQEKTVLYLLHEGWIPLIGFILFFLVLFNTNRLLRKIKPYKLYEEEETGYTGCESSVGWDMYWNS